MCFGIKRIKKKMATSSHDTGLGEVDRADICQELPKYAKDYSAPQAAKFSKNKYPTINEYTVRTFVKQYDENVKVAKACGRSPDRKLKTLMRGRPLMVGPIIYEKVRQFMVSLYKRGSC